MALPGGGNSDRRELPASEISVNASPAPYVRQYDLQPLLSQLKPTQALWLVLLMVKGATIELEVPPQGIQEWKEVASWVCIDSTRLRVPRPC